MIVFDDLKVAEKLTIYDKGINVISGENLEYGNYEVKIHEGDVWSPYIEIEDALYNSLDFFLRAIEDNRQSITGPEQAIRILKTLEKADKRMNQ